MSELKAETIIPQGTTISLQMYPKGEVDKAIADLEESYKKEVEQLLMEIVKLKEFSAQCQSAARTLQRKLRYNKYKRCLAMAWWCEAEVYNIRRTPLCDMSEHEYWQYENDFWQRWQKRWLKLAEVFK